MTTVVLYVMGLVIAAAALWVWRRARRAERWPSRWLQAGRIAACGGLMSVALLLIMAGTGWYLYTHRDRPSDIIDQPLFQGITYSRIVRDDPRPLIVYVVTVDLDAPGIEFLVTPAEPVTGPDMPARTTSEFLEEFGVQLAINGSYFKPWWATAPWDYYPHSGDPVNVTGFASSCGDVYSDDYEYYPAFYISSDNRVSIELPAERAYNALAASHHLIVEGENWFDLDHEWYKGTEPRTAIGYNRAGDTLILVLIDGRQPNYSEGVTLPELAGIMREFGAYTAMNLDGGGSTTLVIEGESGAAEVLNSPIHTRIPGRERPVANHLGIYALPLE